VSSHLKAFYLAGNYQTADPNGLYKLTYSSFFVVFSCHSNTCEDRAESPYSIFRLIQPRLYYKSLMKVRCDAHKWRQVQHMVQQQLV
jgi:hypothetical protein